MPISRLIPLPLALALLAPALSGCGGSGDPAAPPKSATADSPKSAAGADTAPDKGADKAAPKDTASGLPPPPAAAGWTDDVKAMAFPPSAAAGRVNGRTFIPGAADLSRISGRFLTLRQGDEFRPDLEVRVLLSADKGDNFAGKSYEFTPNSGRALPVSLSWKVGDRQPVERAPFDDKYALRLEFGQEAGGKLPGKIYLCLPDAARSYVAGTFSADVEPDYAKPPRPDELPCVAGRIALKGRDEYNLVAGFIGLTADGKAVTNLAGTKVLPKVETSVACAPYAPQRSALVNDADAGCLCRHARLAPGRYLMFVGVGDRYIDWHWVEVGPATQLLLDFAVEPDAAAAVEVTLPKGAKGGVRLVPLDAAGKVPDIKEALAELPFAMNTEAPAKDGKVLLDGLRPGRYRVTVGDVGKDVALTAKETAKVDLSAP